MIIDQSALDNLNFSLNTSSESDALEDESKIDQIINKYHIVENKNHLISSQENNFLFLTNHITQLYYLRQSIPEDIAELLKNDVNFKIYLQDDLNRRLNNLISNNSTIFFKEIGNIINLLSLGEVYRIFETYTKYNLDEVSKLFRAMETYLQSLDVSSKLFDLAFNSYLILVEAFTQLCIINSTDIQRKKTINPIIELLTESNNMLKFTVTLTETKIDQLNNILGKLLYYFSHISYYEIQSKSMDYLLEEFLLNSERQQDGYQLSKDTLFGNNEKVKQQEFVKFKSNNAFLILTLIKKLEENFAHEDFMNNGNFQKIIMEYNNNFSLQIQEKSKETLESFRQKLLDSLVLTYAPYTNEDFVILTHKEVIDDFILAAEDLKPINLEIIHNVLLFSKDIQSQQYLQIALILTSLDNIQNDYYQFFSIKTLDIIIHKFLHEKFSSDIQEVFQKIFEYCELHKTASQLLAVFSKIYLSLSLYYSHTLNKKTIHQAKEFYSIFVNINGLNPLKNEFSIINQKILMNIGKFYSHELELEGKNLSKADLYTLGKSQIMMFLKFKDLNLKYLINEKISSLTSQILSQNSFDYEDINSKISHFISRILFYGVCEVNIRGLTKGKSAIEDSGYKQHSITLLNAYEILFIFPAVYEEIFKLILKKNKEYIIQNVSNILIGYSKNNILYIDEITHLENITKIKHDMSEFHEQVTFMEISIPSLIYVNKKYGQDSGDKFFRAIAQKIKSFLSRKDRIFRLSGARLGIMLDITDSYSDLIEKIFNFCITLKGEQIEGDYILSVTKAHKDQILVQSAYNIEEAISLNKSTNIKI